MKNRGGLMAPENFDIIKDDKDRVFDIEMQMTVTKELPKRSRYYHSMLDLQLIDKGQTYAKLKPSFVIFICLSDMFQKIRLLKSWMRR